MIGAAVGPYRVLEKIGEGGMGEVYRARDTRLDRDVAIKILPEPFAADPERLARFDREAKTLASLNHPNIAIVHGVEEGPDVGAGFSRPMRALVMELVDGPTLADRIAQGPIPIDEALPIARQITEALEAAHEQGIVHRDLKPANIKVRDEGTVKVLDFGLAKLAEGTSSEGGPPKGGPYISNSPTITSPALMTGAGVLLGTAAYMSPEQARGKAVDKRSDIWAFGCVLYEMLSGTRAFHGDEVADTLAHVLTKQPDWTGLPHATPEPLRRLLRRCLEKDRKRRLADAADARIDIDEAIASPTDSSGGTARSARRSLGRDVGIAAAAFLLGAIALGAWSWANRSSEGVPTVTRFAVPLGAGERLGESGSRVLAISPDGTQLAFVVGNALHLRSLRDMQSRPIPGTEHQAGQVRAPVFSPDGRSIAFVSSVPARIKRVAVSGGAPVTLCDGCGPLGTMSWDERGIVFAQGGSGLPLGYAGERAATGANRIMRVAADGGEPETLFEVKDGMPWDVQMLPDGEHVLFGLMDDEAVMLSGMASDSARVVVQSLRTGQRKTVITGAVAPRYLATGHLLYVRQGVLFARRFDPDRIEVVGAEAPVVEGVRRAAFVGGGTMAAYFDVSESGALVYLPGPVTSEVSFDLGVLDPRTGTRPLKLPPAGYEFPRVSPDGKSIAVGSNDGRVAHIWIYDRAGAGAFRQLTFASKNRFPIWSTDGQYVTYQSDREGTLALFRQRADGSGVAERLTKPGAGAEHVPSAWAPGDQTLLFEALDASGRTIWTRSHDGMVRRFGNALIPQSFAGPLDPVFSPNGRWVAYRTVAGSGASRGPLIVVEPATPNGTQHVIGGGLHPSWSRDGKTLFFRRLNVGEFLAVQILSEAPFAFSTPQTLPFSFAHRQSNSSARYYDTTPEGTFIGVVRTGGPAPEGTPQVNVVLNWVEELKQRVR